MPQTIWNFVIGKDTISATIDKIIAKTGKVAEAAGKAEGAFNGFLGRTGTSMGNWYRKNLDNVNQLIDAVPGLGNALQLATNPVAAGAAVATGLVAAAKQAADFEKNMAKVNVTAQLSQGELKKLSADILDTGKAVGLSDISKAPDAFNRIISAGLNVQQSMALLKPTLQAAKAGFTDVETVAAAAVSTMNASGITDATNLYDILFATLNKGNAEFADIAQYLPKIIPDARGAGISLEETAGAFAYLTAQGYQAEAAASRLQNVFKALGDSDRIAAFKKIGVDVFDAQGQMRGIMPIIQDLSGALAGLTEQQRARVFDTLGLDMEASSAINSLTQDTAKLAEILGFVGNSAGQFEQAISNAANSTDTWNSVMGKLQVIIIKTGQVALPLLNAGLTAVDWALNAVFAAANTLSNLFNTALGGAIGFINANADILTAAISAATVGFVALNTQLIITAAGGLAQFAAGSAIATVRTIALNGAMLAASITTKLYAAAQWLLNAALNANPVGLVIAALAALSAGIYIAYQRSNKFRAVIAGIGAVAQAIMPVIGGLAQAVAGIFTFNPALALKGITQATESIKDIATKGMGNIFSGAFNESLSASNLANTITQAEEAANNAIAGKNHPLSGNLNTNPTIDPGKINTPKPAAKTPKLADILDNKTGNNKTEKSPGSRSISAGIGADGGAAARNITITIQKLVENITIQNAATQGISQSAISAMVQEALVRAVRDAEIAISN